MVLVRADHPVDVSEPVPVEPDPGGPVAGALDEQGASFGLEGVVAGPGQVAVGPPGDVGGDVLLVAAGADRDRTAGRVPNERRSDVEPGAGRLPREPGALAPEAGGDAACGLEPVHPVAQHRLGRGGVRRGEEGQGVDLRVPEDVTAVAGPGEAAGADSRLALVGGGDHEAEQAEADGTLELRGALDRHVAVVPALTPARPLGGVEALEALAVGLAQRAQRAGLVRGEGGQPVERVVRLSLGGGGEDAVDVPALGDGHLADARDARLRPFLLGCGERCPVAEQGGLRGACAQAGGAGPGE